MPQGTFGFAAQGQPDEIERGGPSLCCNPKWANKARTLSKPTVALLMLHLSAAGMTFPGQRVFSVCCRFSQMEKGKTDLLLHGHC